MTKINKSPFEFDPDEFLESTIRFGMYKGVIWKEIIKDDPSYIEWVINNIEYLTEFEKNTLVEAIELDDQ